MKSSFLILSFLISTQAFSQAFPGSFKAERHFYSLSTSCDEAKIPQAIESKLHQEAYLEALATSQTSNCHGMINIKRESKHSCDFIKVDGLDEEVANHILTEQLKGLCIPG